jgi:hypothetical protein
MFSQLVKSSFESKIPLASVQRTGDSSSDHSRAPAAMSTARVRSDDERKIHPLVGACVPLDRSVEPPRFTRKIQDEDDLVGSDSEQSSNPGTGSEDVQHMRDMESRLVSDLSNRLLVKGQSKGASGKSSLPPTISTTIEVHKVLRFRAQSTAANSIQTTHLFGACGAMGITATTVQYIASSVRLRSIVIWNPATTTSTSLVYWGYSTAAGFIKDESKSRSLPDGVTVTGAQSFSPPKGSLLNGWLSSSLGATNVICVLSCPAGSIIDVHVDFTIQNLNASYSALTVASATSGRIYYLPLDGVTQNNLRAQGVTTTS